MTETLGELPFVTVQRDVEEAGARRSGAPRMLLVAALVAAAGSVGWQARSPRAAVAPPVAAAPESVRALGRLEPAGEVLAVVAPDGVSIGRIHRVLVREGDRVGAGAVLAVLDNEGRLLAERATAERRVRKAEAAVAQAQVAVASARGELAASLASARATSRVEASSRERQHALHRGGYAAREVLDHASLRAEAAELAVREVEARLVRYAPAEGAVGEPVDVAVARQELELARAALGEATVRLEQAYVRSPIEGTVLDVHRRPGEAVAPGALFDLGDTRTMYARLDVYETDVGRLRAGQAVALRSSALAGPLDGVVERVSPLVKKQSVVDAIPAANTDARVVEVLVRLGERSAADARRFVGLQVRAEVTL